MAFFFFHQKDVLQNLEAHFIEWRWMAGEFYGTNLGVDFRPSLFRFPLSRPQDTHEVGAFGRMKILFWSRKAAGEYGVINRLIRKTRSSDKQSIGKRVFVAFIKIPLEAFFKIFVASYPWVLSLHWKVVICYQPHTHGPISKHQDNIFNEHYLYSWHGFWTDFDANKDCCAQN